MLASPSVELAKSSLNKACVELVSESEDGACDAAGLCARCVDSWFDSGNPAGVPGDATSEGELALPSGTTEAGERLIK